MKYLVAISILFAASTAIATDIDPRISHIADRLSSTDAYTDSARFSMTMEAMSTDVGCDVNLAQRRADGDTLAPCSYIIRWRDSENGRSGGFAAYYHGNLFRFSGRKLTEFHAAEDTTVFRPSNPSAGMQQTAQYAYLLPAFIGAELRKMAGDPDYTLSFNPDTIIGGRHLQSVGAILSPTRPRRYPYFWKLSTIRARRASRLSQWPTRVAPPTIAAKSTSKPSPPCFPSRLRACAAPE